MKKIILMLTALILVSCTPQPATPATQNPASIPNLITVTAPLPNQTVSSPITITGQARGYWFFEGSFPVVLTNWDGIIIAETFATAQTNWMTEDFVQFEANLDFTSTDTNKNATLILKKDNPSGLPENDDALEIPITLS